MIASLITSLWLGYGWVWSAADLLYSTYVHCVMNRCHSYKQIIIPYLSWLIMFYLLKYLFSKPYMWWVLSSEPQLFCAEAFLLGSQSTGRDLQQAVLTPPHKTAWSRKPDGCFYWTCTTARGMTPEYSLQYLKKLCFIMVISLTLATTKTCLAIQ